MLSDELISEPVIVLCAVDDHSVKNEIVNVKQRWCI